MIDGILRNQVLWAAAAGWIAAQTIKVIVHLLRYRKIDLRFYTSTGGMPSANVNTPIICTMVVRRKNQSSVPNADANHEKFAQAQHTVDETKTNPITAVPA